MLFAQQYRAGRISPSDCPVRSRTVEDVVRHVAQAITRLGAVDPRLNTFGELDFRLATVLRSWKKRDPPPTRVKPLPMIVLRKAHALSAATPLPLRISPAGDCLLIAFFFLLRPGEYSGAPRTATDDLFRVHNVGLWIGHRRLNPLCSPDPDLLAATFVTLTFTTQKNGVRGETIGHSRSGHPCFLCPVGAVVRRLLHLRGAGAAPATPLNAYRMRPDDPWCHVLPADDITSLLRRTVTLLPPSLTDISARSTRAGGAMAMLCGGIDSDRIRLIGRWRSDKMYRYLHVQPQPIMSGVAALMLRGGDYIREPISVVCK